MVCAAIMALMMDSSTACTVAAKIASRLSFGNILMVTGFSRFRRVVSRWRSDEDVAGAVPGNAAVAAQAKRDRAARWKSDFDYVVAHFAKDDCAGFGRARTRGGDFVANGNDGGSGAVYGRSESGAAAVFQSAAQDGDTGCLAGI